MLQEEPTTVDQRSGPQIEEPLTADLVPGRNRSQEGEGTVEVLATAYIPGTFGGSAWKDVWAFVLLILVLVFRPQGLLGARVVDRA